MKTKLFTILIVSMLLLLSGCSKDIVFNSLDQLGITSNVKNNVIVDGKPIFKEAYIFEDFESYKKYYHEFFESYGEVVPPLNIDFKNENLILCNTLLSEGKSGLIYRIETIKRNGNTIKVYLSNEGSVKVNDDALNKYYNHSCLIKLDKNLISETNEIILIRP